TACLRRMLTLAPADAENDSAQLALAYRTMLLGLSHLWDGDAYQAEAILQPALIQAEKGAGRRSMVASLFAAVLAAALLERDQPTAAQSLLANRLDVIERTGFPDTILLAYRTLAYVALSQGDERRALNLLDSLGALAERRRLPRLSLHSLTEQIRVHALRSCTETVDHLVQRLEQLAGAFEQEEFLPFLPQYRLASALAKTYAALAKQDLDDAEQQLQTADSIANQLHRRRDALTAKVLRAVLARQRNATQALPLLAEALSLASIGGNARLLADTHPFAVQMAAGLDMATAGVWVVRASGPAVDPPAPAASSIRPGQLRSGPLTPKEAEVMNLLDKGMSNKLIARAMEISDETVKWHVKNLFLKLSAGTRKHAVDRARLLGLIGT
ncbi:MAG: LuxR C-terminal-related transcriptional regulator, partial [Luteimonas sp.]